MSSASSFGGSPAMRASVLSSKSTSPTAHGGVVASNPNGPLRSNTSSHAALPAPSSSSSSSFSPRHHKFPHDVVDPPLAHPPLAPSHNNHSHAVHHQQQHHHHHHHHHASRKSAPTAALAHASRSPQEVIDLTDNSDRAAPRAAFDPIRGAKSGHRASNSPTIASLIDHPPQQQQQKAARSTNVSPTSGYPPDAILATTGSSITTTTTTTTTTTPTATIAATTAKKNGAKSASKASENPSPKSKTGTAPPSAAASPKHRPTVPTGSGNGLLSNVFEPAGNRDAEAPLPNIYLHVPLNGENNKYVNFAKLAEERYGWAALNPRLAAAREQMLRGDISGDEMMLDGSESESNAEFDRPMGGMGGESTAEPKKTAKKRRNKDIYDKDDPFIDDSEMLWEEQAAASKDGFFVYSGPLVREGEKPQIERADGTVKRGRGRGRGTGARGGTTTARGATVRKPRVTKKDKEKMEREKQEREKFALAAAAQLPKVPAGH